MKKPKIHRFDFEHYLKFPEWDSNRINATKCGYVRDNVTIHDKEVTCKLCLRVMKG